MHPNHINRSLTEFFAWLYSCKSTIRVVRLSKYSIYSHLRTVELYLGRGSNCTHTAEECICTYWEVINVRFLAYKELYHSISTNCASLSVHSSCTNAQEQIVPVLAYNLIYSWGRTFCTSNGKHEVVPLLKYKMYSKISTFQLNLSMSTLTCNFSRENSWPLLQSSFAFVHTCSTVLPVCFVFDYTHIQNKDTKN